MEIFYKQFRSDGKNIACLLNYKNNIMQSHYRNGDYINTEIKDLKSFVKTFKLIMICESEYRLLMSKLIG